MISPPGRGKSEFCADLVDYLSARDNEEWGFAKAFLATYTPPDLIGYQFKGERTWDGRTHTVTDPSMPLWMITTKGKPTFAYKRGILLLDEYGQGEADVKRASAELLLNKQIGPWSLEKGWGVIACSNRSSDRSGVTKSFDFVINRRKEIHITDDIAAWTHWAHVHGVMPLTVAFANQNPGIVFTDGVPDKQGPWCTPRSLVMADRELAVKAKRNGGEVPDNATTIESIGGIIGSAAAAQLFSFVKLEREMPSFDTIIKNPTTVKVPSKADAQMLVCLNLAHRVTELTAAPVVTYVERMPKEFAVTFATAACRRNAQLVKVPAFQAWCRNNASLMAIIAGVK
jgi:hypothetical protein